MLHLAAHLQVNIQVGQIRPVEISPFKAAPHFPIQSFQVQTSLANFFTQPLIQWGAILACSVMATLPFLALFHWLQRYIVITDSRTGIK